MLIGADEAEAGGGVRRAVVVQVGEGEEEDGGEDLPGVDYAAIDAVLARSEAAIANTARLDRGGRT